MTRQIHLIYRCRQCTQSFTYDHGGSPLCQPDEMDEEDRRLELIRALREKIQGCSYPMIYHHCGPTVAGIAELIGAQVEETEP